MMQNFSNFSNDILQYHDWWPQNLTPENKLKRAQFESFDLLVGRMNSWLAENQHINVKNFQTLEKKVGNYEQLDQDVSSFDADARMREGIFLKGLRVWYDTDTVDSQQVSQISYMNVLPQITDGSQSYPMYEKLDGLFHQANGNPVPGRIITVETVSMQLFDCDVRELFPDKCHWRDGYRRDVLSFIRIFYNNSSSSQEIIGAADFVPICCKEKGMFSAPQFENISSVQSKIDDWLRNVQDVRLLNMQCLETPYADKSEQMDSSINFVIDYEHQWSVKFMRVYYARPVNGSISTTLPQQVSVKCFYPARILRTCCLNVTTFQVQSEMNVYVQAWLRLVGRRVIFAEMMYRHMTIIEAENMYTGDMTVHSGQWYTTRSNNRTSYHRFGMVYGLRVYLDGSYTEPPEEHLPPKPHFEDKSCCTIL